MSRREMVEGMVGFLINNRNYGLSVDRVFEIFWRFNGDEYQIYSSIETCKKIIIQMWNDKELLRLVQLRD